MPLSRFQVTRWNYRSPGAIFSTSPFLMAYPAVIYDKVLDVSELTFCTIDCLPGGLSTIMTPCSCSNAPDIVVYAFLVSSFFSILNEFTMDDFSSVASGICTILSVFSNLIGSLNLIAYPPLPILLSFLFLCYASNFTIF